MHFYGWIYTAGLDAQFWIFAYIRFLKHCVRVCVSAAVRHNRLTSDATDQEIETRITKWLQNAPDRNGGRSERMRRKERWKAMPNCSLMLLLFEQMLLLFEEKTVFQCLFAFLNSMQCFSVFFPPQISVFELLKTDSVPMQNVCFTLALFMFQSQFTVKCFLNLMFDCQLILIDWFSFNIYCYFE